MANNFVFRGSLPIAPLKIAVLENCKNLAVRVNDHIVQSRRNDIEGPMRRRGNLHYHGYDVDSYLLHCNCPRLEISGDKAVINESVGGTDVFAMVNVVNYSIPYTVSGYTSHMPPDDHFQGLKRIIEACPVAAHGVSVVMPFLYEGRQHERSKHESLDCAMALEELATLGVENIITFDTHDPRVQNATPLIDFDDFMSTYQFVKILLSHDSNIRIDKEHLMVVSPDEGTMNHAVYLANNLDVDTGMLYKCKDYLQVIGGRNPIMAYELLGSSVEGKTAFIINDMISSGESMPDTCRELKEHRADRVIVCYTFGLLTNGLEKFDEYYHQGYLDYIITTNLGYRTQELTDREWCLETDMSKYPAAVISSMNRDRSISAPPSSAEKIQKLIQKHQNGGYGYFQKLV